MSEWFSNPVVDRQLWLRMVIRIPAGHSWLVIFQHSSAFLVMFLLSVGFVTKIYWWHCVPTVSRGNYPGGECSECMPYSIGLLKQSPKGPNGNFYHFCPLCKTTNYVPSSDLAVCFGDIGSSCSPFSILFSVLMIQMWIMK